MAQFFFYRPSTASVSIPGGITANQGTPNNDANAWPVRITDGTHDATVTAGGALNVNIGGGLANPLPVTDAAAEASLASIDGKVATQATLLAFSNKSASSFVNVPFDETVITYVGASTRIDTVTYKLATVTVQTLTMSYDGSDRLVDVVKT